MGTSKHRKGGKKVRKMSPSRRIKQALDRIDKCSTVRHDYREMTDGAIKTAVALGILKPMSGTEFQSEVNRTNRHLPSPKKLARLLMPNATF